MHVKLDVKTLLKSNLSDIMPQKINTKTKKDRLIDTLATKLARNLISISFSDPDSTEAASVVLNNPNERNGSERFIVVIGAGASKHANEAIPLGREAIDILKGNYNIGSANGKQKKNWNKELNKLYNNEIEELSQVYRLDKNDFETVLLALSKYYPKDIYDKLATYYGYRYYPDLFYELLAHMFKNRFIDAIINFNFDELLDQAIEDDLGSSAYRKVIFDGDITDYDTDVIKNDHFQRPFYVKPHGTFSHKTSMRFTRRDYFNISDDIDIFLGKLLSGKLNNKPKIPVNLLVFGFNMESFEFIRLLKKSLPDKSTIYIFDKSHKGVFNKEIESLNKSKDLKFFNIRKNCKISTEYIPWNKKKSSIDNILLSLYEKITEKFKAGYKPVGIKRHVCISNLFKYGKPKKRSEIEDLDYFKDRVYIELVLQIAESKGFISLQQLTNDRTGRYYNLYKKSFEKYKPTNKNKPKDKALSLFDFCENLGLKPYSYSREFYMLPRNVNIKTKNKITLSKEGFDAFVNTLISKLEGKVTTEIIERIKCDAKKDQTESTIPINRKFTLVATLNDLFDSEDSEFCQKDKDIHDNIFKDPTEINTKLAFSYETIKMFSKVEMEKWDYFLSIAETGEWLVDKIKSIEFEDKKIKLILADMAHADELEKMVSDINQKCNKKNTIEIYQLFWWLHNQHMSLFLKRNETKGDIEIYKVIYFTRKSRSNLITPVILEDNADKKIALEIFAAYLQKALLQEANKHPININTENVKSALNALKKELLT